VKRGKDTYITTCVLRPRHIARRAGTIDDVKAITLLALTCSIGCGGIEGEPMDGDIALHYGTANKTFEVGAAVPDKDDTNQLIVQLGTDNVDCKTYLNELVLFGGPKGYFVYFGIDAAMPKAYDNAYVSVEHTTDRSSKTNIADGAVVIDAIADRVTGTVMFDTTDDELGKITVTGSFDVLNCALK
jgi:hypothetical protein